MKSWTSPTYSPGNGMLFGIGSHTFDQALVLFGRPEKITGFYRSLRGIESEVDDAFTVILQYGGEKKNLVVTVKTSVVCVMQHPLKYFVRGYDGTFVKYGTDRQEKQAMSFESATNRGFGAENLDTYGLLTTKAKVDQYQGQDEESKRWVGKVPSLRGNYLGYYEDLVKAIRGEKELVVKPETARDGLRIIEIARESAEKGITLLFN
jgi:predicted dehydrogenase